MTCRCFHIVGENLLCREHGGEDIWLPGAYKQPVRAIDYPPSPINFRDPWWDFMDAVPEMEKREKVLAEAIP
jgi:hypothetical protein